jgi:hypothetical protein
VFLPDKLIERSRAHAVGEGASALVGGVFRRDGREQVHKIISPETFVIGNL